MNVEKVLRVCLDGGFKGNSRENFWNNWKLLMTLKKQKNSGRAGFLVSYNYMC